MFGFDGNQRSILHLTWVAFFLTFVAWFNLAPFNTTLQATLGLTREQIDILMICNVALTIPARIVIGTLVDRFGPKTVFVYLLLLAAVISFGFAFSRTFTHFLIARLMMGIIGAGFVVGIKMIAEWFPPEKMGTAQGIYAGWGNFGAAAAVFVLPLLASPFSLETGWRIAAGFSGLLCLVWAGVYHRFAREIPQRAEQFRVSLQNTIEVTSRKDLVLLSLLLMPVYLAIGLFLWKLTVPPTPFIPQPFFFLLALLLAGLWGHNVWRSVIYNSPHLSQEIPEHRRYPFIQVVILCMVYALTFGSELAVVSMFPEYLETTFDLPVTLAGILASSFAFFNLVTRPAGGWLSDLWGRRRTLFVLVLGTVICYWLMGDIHSGWSVWMAVGLAVVCSVLIQAGNGACFAMVPLIRRDLTGRLAGMTGAYGNVGALFFLTLLSLVDASSFFKWIGGYALIVLLSLFFLTSFNTLHQSFKSSGE